jgi:hypothetical protein
VAVGAEAVRNTLDVKKDGVKVNDAKSVVRNTVVGLGSAGVTKAVPSTKIKVQAEVTPKQAVKAAREGGAVVNRAQRKSIQTSAKKTLKEAKAINNPANGAGKSTATGAASESAKRKGDKLMEMAINKVNSSKDFFKKIPLLWILIIVVFLVLLFRNDYNISKLRNEGEEVKGRIYRKSGDGSKGTIRCFYNFEVAGKQYEGFYDNKHLNQWDSLEIIYYRKDPNLNQAKQFVDDY